MSDAAFRRVVLKALQERRPDLRITAWRKGAKATATTQPVRLFVEPVPAAAS